MLCKLMVRICMYAHCLLQLIMWPCFTIQLREVLVLYTRHGSPTLLHMSVYREPFKIARRLGYAA